MYKRKDSERILAVNRSIFWLGVSNQYLCVECFMLHFLEIWACSQKVARMLLCILSSCHVDIALSLASSARCNVNEHLQRLNTPSSIHFVSIRVCKMLRTSTSTQNVVTLWCQNFSMLTFDIWTEIHTEIIEKMINEFPDLNF